MSENATKESCGNGCGIAVTERNRYFTGKYMTARDFAGEQEYFLNRNRIRNRLLLGWGIVCGLRVIEHPDPGCRERWVVVKSGVAMDCCGREIFLHKDTALEIPIEDLPWSSEEEVKESRALAKEAAEAEKREDEEDDDEKHEDKSGNDVDDWYEDEHAAWPSTGLLVCLRYSEECIEPVPTLYAEGNCDPTHQEANRVREAGVLEVRRLDTMRPDCWRLPSGAWDTRCHDDCDEPLPGPAGVCLEPDCPCHGCVPLALLVRRPDPNPGEPPFFIDRRGSRHLPTPSHYLTHIVGINWPHGGQITLQHLRNDMDGKLKVRFNRRILPAHGMRTGINPHTFFVEYGGIQRTLEFLPGADGDDPKLDEEGYTATFNIDPHYMDRGARYSIADNILYITLRCDFIIDCHEMPVDGNHSKGRLPSGNGTPGGEFKSWFRVIRDYRSREGD